MPIFNRLDSINQLHVLGLRIAREQCRSYPDQVFLDFLIRVASRNPPKMPSDPRGAVIRAAYAIQAKNDQIEVLKARIKELEAAS